MSGEGGPAEISNVLSAWFGPDADDATIVKRQHALWFVRSDATDRFLRETFGDLVARALRGEITSWGETQRGRLALLVVCDQLTRNIFRGTPRAFEGDPLALATSRAMIAADEDLRLRPIERLFVYLPLEHAEDLAVQNLAVARFEKLLDVVTGEARGAFAAYFDYAVRHRDIIQRFGRFPHRNVILGRASTDEEIAFLKEPFSSF
ncbi:DUF924 family protein [Polyangium jinanense]|uniref:DUF924 domain-containing protein n=1 Tax=Polyangium jinanense TaxID=2829994 RepID=A0A9X4APW5_9BACT|nr:DUF924 family protein [Polyangium jinanense]MDC3952834.1 DUF924 domain-containing protein [Polyangium jinanense]MDC3980453.1 DUF924 domain-containing protein [Polyangium jinanense]